MRRRKINVEGRHKRTDHNYEGNHKRKTIPLRFRASSRLSFGMHIHNRYGIQHTGGRSFRSQCEID